MECEESNLPSNKLEYDLYNQYRQEVVQVQYELSRTADKYILSLSTGLLSFSLVFMKDLFASQRFMPILIVSWLALLFAISSTVLSFWVGQKRCKSLISKMDKEYVESQTITFSAYETRWAKLNRFLNGASLLFFFMGLLAMAAFVIINIIR